MNANGAAGLGELGEKTDVNIDFSLVQSCLSMERKKPTNLDRLEHKT